MGYTHISKPCGVDGLYKGAKGSEYNIDTKQTILTYTFDDNSATQTVFNVVPFPATIVAAYLCQMTTTQTLIYTSSYGSAATAVISGTYTSPGTIGVPQTCTIDSATVSSGIAIGVTRTVAGTAGASTVTMVLTRTGA